MGIVAWLVLGLLAGAIAKLILPGRDPGGCVGTTVTGIAGAFLGGWLSATFLDRPVRQDFFDAATWGSAVVGALVLLIAYRLLFGHSRR
ncbi:GlsB/YeaQ/YmgE family stress response membrane protein [Streptomyces sp. NPDC023723]|uniref:GlsB/YeaQ/YmgE family stress response membrane protein n=1 Tax=Streptomyces sp. NPDC023723 TaxID=3154323 RepID=UPI00340B0EAE